MTPHEEEYPRRPDHINDNWGMFPFLIGVAAIAAVGIIVLTGNS